MQTFSAFSSMINLQFTLRSRITPRTIYWRKQPIFVHVAGGVAVGYPWLDSARFWMDLCRVRILQATYTTLPTYADSWPGLSEALDMGNFCRCPTFRRAQSRWENVFSSPENLWSNIFVYSVTNQSPTAHVDRKAKSSRKNGCP